MWEALYLAKMLSDKSKKRKNFADELKGWINVAQLMNSIKKKVKLNQRMSRDKYIEIVTPPDT